MSGPFERDAMQPQTGNKSTRARAIIACTECHRRRKRCSLEQPCRSCARRYPPAECIYLPAPPLKRRSGAGRAAKRSTSPSRLKDDTKHEISVHSVSDSDLPTTHLQPVRSLPLLVNYVALSPAASDSRSRDSELNCSTPDTDYDEVDDIDWNSLTYSKYKLKPAFGRDRDHTPPRGELHRIKRSVTRSCDAPSLPRSFGAGCMELLAQVGVEPSLNNVELFKIYIEYCAPWLWSLDGNGRDWAPDHFKNTWLQMSVSSPIVVHVSLAWAVMRRYTLQAGFSERQHDPQTLIRKSMECMAMKGKSLALLNARLRSVTDLGAVDDEIICSVASFLNFEWTSGIEGGVQHILPHIRALREMLRQRGGTSKLGMGGYTAKIIMMAHYQLATVLECEPFMFSEELLHDHLDLTHQTINGTFDSPLFIPSGLFIDKAAKCGLHQINAQILDEMTLIFDEMRSFNFGDRSIIERDLLLCTVKEFYNRICSLPSANDPHHPTTNDFVYEACRVAAIIYLKAITTFTPISQACKPDLLDSLFAAIRNVPPIRWKPMSGVWMWIVLSINPDTEDQWPGPHLKALIQRSTYHVFTWDWQTYVNIMETHLCVQRWIRGFTRGKVPLAPSRRRQSLMNT